tara:strand:+ start:60 stop:209 length:150 start_codon:yes stop_codon:yes gene_type:complete
MNISVKSKKINDFTYELSISAKWEDIKSDFLLAKKEGRLRYQDTWISKR